MMKIYPEINPNPEFSKIEESILKFWQEHNIFQKSIDNRPRKINEINNEFIFYDGPPFANGLPHYGHLLTGYIKDVFARYKTIKGMRVERRFGWDCHGLPAEMGAEKELNISGRTDIMKYGVDKFNDYCRNSVLKYTQEWEEYVTRQARWVDFADDYKTMDTPYMESVIWAFRELYNKGLIYESMRVMPYSWACQTPLSNFETKLDNSYRERADKAVTVAFTLKSLPKSLNQQLDCKILAWTTTPWTLPSNLALAIGEKIEYAYIIKNNEYIIIAKSSVSKYLKELGIENENDIDGVISSEELKNIEYQPLFPYFKDNANSFKIIIAEFVTEGDGTGIVHIAPGFGEDDQMICSQNNIELVCPVDDGGRFTQEVKDFSGMQVFDANDEIIKYLKNHQMWIKTEQYLHNYPHCWRTDTPLIYKAVPSWYVKVTEFKDRMVENNKQINWIPHHIKDGLFGKWLENARDWSISRNRFWGTPIPIWKSDNPNYPRIEVYGSIHEINSAFNTDIKDLHKPFIDDLTRPNPDDPTGKSKMIRVADVFDCWFESGSMPFAQVHYPFENKDWFESHFPADFIVEYIAQTRGWFYTLMVLSTALFDKPPFLNCICHGVILDDKGQKLSKRLNNYADPKDLFSKYGSDALRFLMISSNVMRGEEFLIDKEGAMIKDTLRLVIKPIWNAYNFFTIYANSDSVKAEMIYDSENVIDKYILSKLKYSIEDIDKNMNLYDTVSVCNVITDFFEILNNWYIRRSRNRFWKTEKDDDKIDAYNTLFTVLNSICICISPILPLIAEEIYKNLNNNDSVHLKNFPTQLPIIKDDELTRKMDYVREICSVSLSIRNDENIRIRLPLSELKIISKDETDISDFVNIIKEEVNVKKIEFSNDIEEFAKEKLQLNFPILGKRLPVKMKEILSSVKNNDWTIENDEIIIAGEKIFKSEASFMLIPNDCKNTRSLIINKGVVVLDLSISKELEEEGIARDIVRAIQNMRKDANLNISDKIKITFSSKDEVINIIKLWESYISEQTLSSIFYNVESLEYSNKIVISDHVIDISITKI